MTNVGLGARMAVGVADTTGNNKGNWTVTFDPNALAISTSIPYFEMYKMVVNGAPGSALRVFVDLYQWSGTLQGGNNEWDPAQPLQLQQGQTMYVYYSDPITDQTPPTVTIWLRYDKSLSDVYGIGSS